MKNYSKTVIRYKNKSENSKSKHHRKHSEKKELKIRRTKPRHYLIRKLNLFKEERKFNI